MSHRALVLFVGDNDWANVCHGWARALTEHSTRFRARCVITNPHPAGFAQDITLATEAQARGDEVRQLFAEAAVLVHAGDGDYGSWSQLQRYGLSTEGRALATYHAGSRYRSEPDRFNALDRELGFGCRLIGADSVRLAPRDPRVRPALPVATLGAPPHRGQPIIIGHSPTNRATKGTAAIERAVASLAQVREGRAEWRLMEGLSHDECMRRKAEVTVFVDQVEPAIGGFGVSALEAMGAGAACLASVNNVGPAIDEHWARPPIVDVGSAESLTLALRALLDDVDALFDLRLASWEWARDVAGARPCADRLDRWLGEIVDERRSGIAVADRAIFEATPTPTTSCAVIARVQDDVEAASLRAAVRSVQPYTDECVVVLDDRSRAGAASALEALGARVVARRWTDDFAGARNAAHEACLGEWILVIDSDELLVNAGDLETALTLARSGDHDAVMVTVRTIGDLGPEMDLLQPRVYRKAKCRWRYPIHNELEGVRSAVVSTARIDASYAGTAREKITRSLPLLLAMAEREPDEPRWAYYIARAFNGLIDSDAMARWAERCLSMAPDRPAYAQTWIDLALGRLRSGGDGAPAALSTILEALSHQPQHPDLWHTLAVVGLVQWFRLAPTGASLPANRSTRFAPNLPSVAGSLGLPLAFEPDRPESPAPERIVDD